MSKEAASASFEWKFSQISVPTDHWMVSVKYALTQAPYIGKGHWTMQIPELKNDKLLEHLIDRGMTLQAKLCNPNRAQILCREENPQSLWANFKVDIVKITKKHCKATRGKQGKKITDMESDIKSLARNPEIDTNNNMRAKEVFLASEVATLKCIQARDNKDKCRAAIVDHGKVLGGVWSGMNKDRKPRDVITRLRVPNPTAGANNPHERDTRRMAKLARDYHQNLQAKDIAIPDDSPDLPCKTLKVLSKVPECQRLSEEDLANAEWLISYPQVYRALKLAKNGMATGLDRCLYELWKELNKKCKEREAYSKSGFDIVTALTSLFEDIQTFGIEEKSDFASRWMCPIYKKKDPSNISNFRPITLLNTNYKLMTKSLALQLVAPIHKLIHPNQAGFILK
jgi:hypothetical protein